MRIRILALVLAAVLGLGVSAQAVPTLSLVGTDGLSSIPLNATNDLLVPIYGAGTTSRDGYYDYDVFLNESATLYFTFLGKEAGFVNEFWVGDYSASDPLFTTAGLPQTWTTPGATVAVPVVVPVGGGYIEFSFKTNVTGSSNIVNNGGNNPNTLGPNGTEFPNFFSSFDGDASLKSGTSLVLFLDDGGAGNDDNHDDMVIRISTVPEPGSMLLLGSGLAALLMRRRRR